MIGTKNNLIEYGKIFSDYFVLAEVSDEYVPDCEDGEGHITRIFLAGLNKIYDSIIACDRDS